MQFVANFQNVSTGKHRVALVHVGEDGAEVGRDFFDLCLDKEAPRLHAGSDPKQLETHLETTSSDVPVLRLVDVNMDRVCGQGVDEVSEQERVLVQSCHPDFEVQHFFCEHVMSICRNPSAPKPQATAQRPQVTIMTDRFLMLLPNMITQGLLVGWILEPRSVAPIIYDAVSNPTVYNRLDLVFTHHRELLSVDGRFRYYPYATSRIPEAEHRLHTKTKGVSIVVSEKRQTEGHQLRHAVVDLVRSTGSNVQVLGRGYKAVATKLETLRDFRYSIVIENCREDGYFTEKLLDALLVGTIPVYWGDPSVEEWLDPAGLITFSDVQQLASILPQLTEHEYNRRFHSVQRNLETARAMRHPLDWMWRHGISDLMPPTPVTPRTFAQDMALTLTRLAAWGDSPTWSSPCQDSSELVPHVEGVHVIVGAGCSCAPSVTADTLISILEQRQASIASVTVVMAGLKRCVAQAAEAIQAEHELLGVYSSAISFISVGGAAEDAASCDGGPVVVRRSFFLAGYGPESAEWRHDDLVVFLRAGDFFLESGALGSLRDECNRLGCRVAMPRSIVEFPTGKVRSESSQVVQGWFGAGFVAGRVELVRQCVSDAALRVVDGQLVKDHIDADQMLRQFGNEAVPPKLTRAVMGLLLRNTGWPNVVVWGGLHFARNVFVLLDRQVAASRQELDFVRNIANKFNE